jgi:tRNA-splicing ligase RtcB
MGYPLEQISDCVWEIASSFRKDMRVPVRVVASTGLLDQITRDKSLEQLVNVATLPGVFRHVVGMPDMHEGYGFPVGGVAATVLPDGVISPGGIGFDINCGVRLLATELEARDVEIEPFVHELSRSVPTGYGRGGRLELQGTELDAVLEGGCGELVARGFGTAHDLDHIESRGCLPGADASRVSDRAKERGRDQLGTLGGGNHFLEVQVVDAVYDAEAADALGVTFGQLTILLHTGSRGLGHQVCTDYVKRMDQAASRYGLHLPDRQLACAPLSSPEGKDYFAAMACAANFAWGNRQILTHRVREVLRRVLRREVEARVVYDVAHNISKI